MRPRRGWKNRYPRGGPEEIYTGVQSSKIERSLNISGKRNRSRTGEPLLPQGSLQENSGGDQDVSWGGRRGRITVRASSSLELEKRARGERAVDQLSSAGPARALTGKSITVTEIPLRMSCSCIPHTLHYTEDNSNMHISTSIS